MNNKPLIKVFLGLGNPGPKFHETRHNIGFRVIDALAEHFTAHFKHIENMELATGTSNDHQIIFIKPETFMNNSGQVIPFVRKKGIDANQILVVHDDLELPFGTLKIRFGGSHKGHNGLKSLISHLGTTDFWRLRFGIGRPAHADQVPDYVLAPFNKTETQEIEPIIAQAVSLILNSCN